MTTSKDNREDRREAARRRRLRRERSRRFIGGLAVAVTVTGVIVLAAMLLMDRDWAENADDAALANVEPTENVDIAEFVNGPRIAVDQTAVDHGDVPYGYEASASYQLRNVGDQVLRIENPEVKILDGCWPPVPVVGQTTLQPGDETTLTVAFSMHQGMGGAHKFEIIVPSNDAMDSSTSLFISANYPSP